MMILSAPAVPGEESRALLGSKVLQTAWGWKEVSPNSVRNIEHSDEGSDSNHCAGYGATY